MNIDSGLFSLVFNPPHNFASYRQSELDTARATVFAQMEAFPYMSKRFALERFLGLTEEEITRNEKMWREENNKEEDQEPEGSDLRNVGVSIGGIEADEDTISSMEAPPAGEAPPELGVAGPVQGPGAGAPPAGGGGLTA